MRRCDLVGRGVERVEGYDVVAGRTSGGVPAAGAATGLAFRGGDFSPEAMGEIRHRTENQRCNSHGLTVRGHDSTFKAADGIRGYSPTADAIRGFNASPFPVRHADQILNTMTGPPRLMQADNDVGAHLHRIMLRLMIQPRQVAAEENILEFQQGA